MRSIRHAPEPASSDADGRPPVWTGWSAERRLSRGQVLTLGLLGLSAIACVAVLGPRPVLAVLLGAGTLVFVATTILRLVYIAAGRRPALGAAASEVPAEALPRYSVMVALYHEAEVVPALLDALDRLDYPADRLQVLLLVEDDDPGTAAACDDALRPGWRTVVVPPGTPKTKPRALNYGLPLLNGELFTIFDAEDRPEPDQLRKAVAEFHRQPERVAALQARLDFYNSHQNGLTKWFTCDYASHFGLYLRGVTARCHPTPLGGTSTHFRTQVVRDLGGWDAWNVTEDCELGMRLAAAGYWTQSLDSVTWEEAVPRLGAWIRQRSRWVKGFSQTGLVLLRSPCRTAAAMGWRPYLAALGVVAGVPVVLVTQVIFWALLIVYVGLRVSGADVHPIEVLFPEPLLSLGMLSLLVGNFVVVLAHVSEIYREGRYDLVGWALTVPLYWLLASIGAWRGVLQLISRPHLWEKTQHGLAGAPVPAAVHTVPAGAFVTGEVLTGEILAAAFPETGALKPPGDRRFLPVPLTAYATLPAPVMTAALVRVQVGTPWTGRLVPQLARLFRLTFTGYDPSRRPRAGLVLVGLTSLVGAVVAGRSSRRPRWGNGR